MGKTKRAKTVSTNTSDLVQDRLQMEKVNASSLKISRSPPRVSVYCTGAVLHIPHWYCTSRCRYLPTTHCTQHRGSKFSIHPNSCIFRPQNQFLILQPRHHSWITTNTSSGKQTLRTSLFVKKVRGVLVVADVIRVMMGLGSSLCISSCIFFSHRMA